MNILQDLRLSWSFRIIFILAMMSLNSNAFKCNLPECSFNIKNLWNSSEPVNSYKESLNKSIIFQYNIKPEIPKKSFFLNEMKNKFLTNDFNKILNSELNEIDNLSNLKKFDELNNFNKKSENNKIDFSFCKDGNECLIGLDNISSNLNIIKKSNIVYNQIINQDLKADSNKTQEKNSNIMAELPLPQIVPLYIRIWREIDPDNEKEFNSIINVTESKVQSCTLSGNLPDSKPISNEFNIIPINSMVFERLSDGNQNILEIYTYSENNSLRYLTMTLNNASNEKFIAKSTEKEIEFLKTCFPDNPDPIKPDPIKPDPIKPDPIKPDPIKPDPIKPDR